MNTRNMNVAVYFLFLTLGVWLTSCNKDSSTPSNTAGSSITDQQAVQVQNSDVQDALADKTEEDVDNNLEELQNNNYAASTVKSALSDPKDTMIITVDHPDTTTFPKVVTITYYTYKDSCANETIIKNGKITITVNATDKNHPRLISRAFVFTNFAVTTDSTTVILNGTRTVTRQKDAYKLTGLESARVSVTDHITAALKYAVTTTGSSDTLTYTRNVNKQRTAVSYFKNVNFKVAEPAYNLTHLRFRHILSMDSITYTGVVEGINEKSEPYTKTITDPLIVTEYKGSLVVSAGTITYVVGTTISYQVSFMEDPAHKHMTLVTVKDNLTGKTKSFDRRFGRIFKRWW